MDIDAVRAEIAARLDTIDGLHAYARWPGTPHMPAAIVTDDDPYVEPHQTFGASHLIYVHFIVRVAVTEAPSVDRAVQALDGYVIGGILDAVYGTDKTLGGLVQDVLEVSVSGLRELPIGGLMYLGHEIPFTVIARHG